MFSIILDIVIVVLILIGGLLGYKKGAIKSLVQLISTVSISIVSLQLRGILASFLIKIMPFFNFGKGAEGLYALNIPFYEGISFVVIFILLYCILNILVGFAGLMELIDKFKIIMDVPSKIGGVVFGLVEMMAFSFVLTFSFMHFIPTQSYVMKSHVSRAIVEKMPVYKPIFFRAVATNENVYRSVRDVKKDKSENKIDTNIDIVRYYVNQGIVKATEIQYNIDNGKLHMDNVVIASS